MRDAIGNKLSKGAAILWHKHRLVYRVVEIVEPVIASGDGEDSTPRLRLMLDIPLPAVKRGQEAQLEDFFMLIDPAQQQSLEQAMNRVLGSEAKAQ